MSACAIKSASQGLSGGYEGQSFTMKVLIVFFPALSMYNVLELVILILMTFSKYKGLYFWSLLISSLGIIPYSLGFLFKFGNITTGTAHWLNVVLLTIGWYTMVTGQAVVLWSRLHLILQGTKGQRTLKWTKWMIIINVIILHFPTTVLTFGSNGCVETAQFVQAYNIMEKIQMSGFFIQEVLLSSIYIVQTVRIIRMSTRADTRRIMYQLFAINVIIILMDMALLGMEAASLYLLETITKGVFYSVKLKLEFAILGRLVQFVGGRGIGTSLANDERSRQLSVTNYNEDMAEKASGRSASLSPALETTALSPKQAVDFTNLTKVRTSNSISAPILPAASQTPPNHASIEAFDAKKRARQGSVTRLRPGMTNDDVNMALFEHYDDISLPGSPEPRSPAPVAHDRRDPAWLPQFRSSGFDFAV